MKEQSLFEGAMNELYADGQVNEDAKCPFCLSEDSVDTFDLVEEKIWSSLSKRLLRLEGFEGSRGQVRHKERRTRIRVKYHKITGSSNIHRNFINPVLIHTG